MMRVAIILQLVVLCGLLGLPDQASAQQSDEELRKVAAEMQHGEVRWLEKVIVAQGTGVPNLKDSDKPKEQILRESERAAEADALRKVLEILKGVQVTSEGKAGDKLSQNPEVMMRAQGAIRGHTRLKTKYYKDLGVDMVIAVPLDGQIAEILVPHGETKQAAPSKGAVQFSGLIIDARGLGFAPALAPRLYDDQGKLLYGPDMIDAATLRKYGAVAYADDLEKAKKDARVGDKPLVVKAQKTGDKGKSDLIAAGGETKPLSDPEGNAAFLNEGKVIIVLDPAVAVLKGE